jgi:hypothetical protein
MNLRRFLFWLIITLLFIILRPKAVWYEFNRIYTHRETIWRVLTLLISLYFAYGLYSLYLQGWKLW